MLDPIKGAADGDEFKGKTLVELNAIKTRVKWLLLPAFITIAAVFALSIFTVIKVSEIQMQLADTDRVLHDFVRASKTKQGAHQAGKLIFLQNGLTEAERNEFYHLEEGSEVFPLDWLRALKRKETGNLFLDDVVSMGFVLDPGNPDGLPVGLTAAPSRGLEPLGKMVGLNCAACHVGEMTYKGARLRIDGAPNLLDTRTFFASLIESSFATLEDSKELIAFIGRVKSQRADQKDSAKPEVRTLAGKLLGSLEDKAETVLIDTLGKAIKKIIEDEKNDKTPFDLVGTMKDGVKDAKKFRERVLEKFDNSRVKALVDDLPLKERIDKLVTAADRPGTLLYTLQEVYIGIRLLKARAVYLKKLGLVGTDPRTAWGPGRVDAFGSARAFLFEENYKPINPVSYPFVWGLYRIDWFHYDNNTTSILQRNFGQALGVGAVWDPKTNASSLHPRNLYRLEALATKIKPPAWPEDVFGAIDRDAAKRGEAHYTKLCADCHKLDAKGKLKDQMFDLEKIGTDPGRAKMFAEKLPDGTPFSAAIGSAMDVIMKKSFEDNEITAEEKDRFARAPIPGSGPVEVKWRGPGKYATRPLDGVWATGPFLHNGSVPTLDDLLKPAKDRPVEFYIGNREFDPIKLGYVSTPPEGMKNNFDASKAGNLNIGHEYGTTLSETERRDLLEYLKGL